MKTKKLAVLTCCVLLLVGVVGGTLAWLTDQTQTVTNTFTASDVDIELTENTTNYKMVPGSDIAKDPTVTVNANSEKCWVFVEVTESTTPDFDQYLSYAWANGWNVLINTNNDSFVLYRLQDATTEAVTYPVLKDNKVKVLDTVTKAMMDAIDEQGEAKPTLTFKAGAIQEANLDYKGETDVAKKALIAWGVLNPPSN